MTSPYQWPWVEFSSPAREVIDSTETLFYIASAVTIFDSIIVTNTCQNEIFVNFRILCERTQPDADNPTSEKPYIAYKRPIQKYETIELLPSSKSFVILEVGDFAYFNSDFSGNTFSCFVSGRKLLETQP